MLGRERDGFSSNIFIALKSAGYKLQNITTRDDVDRKIANMWLWMGRMSIGWQNIFEIAEVLVDARIL